MESSRFSVNSLI